MADDNKVTLDLEDWRYDSYSYKVEGTTYTIEKGGTEVPSGRAEKIIEASQGTAAKVHKV
jgi:hypothetical protein